MSFQKNDKVKVTGTNVTGVVVHVDGCIVGVAPASGQLGVEYHEGELERVGS